MFKIKKEKCYEEIIIKRWRYMKLDMYVIEGVVTVDTIEGEMYKKQVEAY